MSVTGNTKVHKFTSLETSLLEVECKLHMWKGRDVQNVSYHRGQGKNCHQSPEGTSKFNINEI